MISQYCRVRDARFNQDEDRNKQERDKEKHSKYCIAWRRFGVWEQLDQRHGIYPMIRFLLFLYSSWQ